LELKRAVIGPFYKMEINEGESKSQPNDLKEFALEAIKALRK
jgi:hypothetical protein